MEPLIPYFDVVKFPITDDLAIHGFGILVALGFVFGARAAMAKAVRDGLDPEVINRVVGWLVAGVFLGGHWGHLLFYYPHEIIEDPLSLFKFWHGLSSFGGFIGCAIFGIWFFRRENRNIARENRRRAEAGEPLQPKRHIWGYADSLLYGFALGWFFGRMGCFVAHDHPGTATRFVLGVKGMVNPNTQLDRDEKLAWIREHATSFPALEKLQVNSPIPDEIWQSIAYHDMGLYEAIWSIILFGAFYLLDKKPRFPGFYVGMTFLLYGPFRLFLDVFRLPSTDTRYFGFTPAQYLSVVLTAIGAWILWSRRGKEPVRKSSALPSGDPAVSQIG